MIQNLTVSQQRLLEKLAGIRVRELHLRYCIKKCNALCSGAQREGLALRRDLIAKTDLDMAYKWSYFS